jgi:hypothetical protein
MKAFLVAYQKQLEVAFLLALLVGMDFAKIQDAQLKYVLMGLVATLTGFRGLQSLIGGGTAPAPTTNVAVSNTAAAPVVPANAQQ